MSTIENNKVIATELKLLTDKFKQHLPETIQEIITLWSNFKINSLSIDILNITYQNLHKLTGSAGTFGYPHISEASRNAATYIQMLIKCSHDNLPDSYKTDGDKYFLSLQNELNKQFLHKQKELSHSTSNITNISKNNTKNDTIIIIGTDEIANQELSNQITYFGYKVSILMDKQLLVLECQKLSPVCVIFNIGSETNLYFKHINELRKAMPYNVAIYVIGKNDNASDQLLSHRNGANLFLSQPVDATELIDRIDSIANNAPLSPARIMIIDDSKDIANFYSLLLENSGMETLIILNPMDALTALNEFCPELILLDLNMPVCNGMELASIIRYKENYISVPIVFLSAEDNYDKRIESLFSGADAFLTKPINEKYLVASVLSRVMRYRNLKKYMVRDSLTNLYNHSTINNILIKEVSRASRDNSDVAFAMIDIDNFKNVNDTYGHPMGDRVIKSLARLISKRIRIIDSAGRYGGEEFAIVLTNITKQQAKKVINDLRRKFAAIPFKYLDQNIFVTFSAGVSMCENGNSAARIKESADKALYISKSQGRNKVTTMDPEIECRN